MYIYSPVSSSKLRTQVQIFVSSHNYHKAFTMKNSLFQRMLDKDYTDVYFLWGIREHDVSSCDAKSSKFCVGTNVWDDTFDPSSDDAQVALKVRLQISRMDNYPVDIVYSIFMVFTYFFLFISKRLFAFKF